jgi:hypothetical protein
MDETRTGGMQMSDMQAGHEAEQSADARALDKPIETCEHCMGRSQLPKPPAAPREVEQSQRGEDLSAPPALSEPLSITSQLHVLISVFRI